MTSPGPVRSPSSQREDVALVTALSGALTNDRAPLEQQATVLRTFADAIESLGRVPTCRIAPFVPGRRSNVEEHYPGFGSSDCVAIVTGENADENRAVILFDIGATHPRLAVDATMRWLDRPAEGVLEERRQEPGVVAASILEVLPRAGHAGLDLVVDPRR